MASEVYLLRFEMQLGSPVTFLDSAIAIIFRYCISSAWVDFELVS